MRRVSPVILLVVLGACSQTGLDLIHAEGAGGSGLGPASGGGAPGGSGSTSDAGPTPTNCDAALAAVAPGQVRIRQVSSGWCMSQGVATTVGMSPAFEVVLEECSSDTAQLWELFVAEIGTYEVRNVATDYNLDMKYASSMDGTPAVLFTPHQLYNQRFEFIPLADAAFQLTPRNATTKCLSERLPGLELWPCTNGDLTQSFELFDGACW